ncbi:unnamed protein product [Closterium sp. NIES-64]|nr:unnamed protein product [Closterium sp. NIES-64]
MVAAVAVVSGSGKRGRMDDFYGEGGIAPERKTDAAVVLYLAGTRTAERQCEHPLFLNMLRAVAEAGTRYGPPKRTFVGGVGLLECKQQIEKALEPVTKTWQQMGVTIAGDMMTDKSGRAQMNIICVNDAGAVFTEVVDCKAAKTIGRFIAAILRPIIKRVGLEYAIALCMDGGSNYKKACKLLRKDYPHIELIPCPTRVLDLLMEDIRTMGWAQDVVGTADDMISFLRKHLWTRVFLRSPKLHGEKVLQVLRPAETRFGTNFIAASRLLALRSQLTQMVTHKDSAVKRGKKTTGVGFEASVMDAAWWKKAEFFVKLMELPYLVMRRTNSAAKGMVGSLYDIMLPNFEPGQPGGGDFPGGR